MVTTDISYRQVITIACEAEVSATTVRRVYQPGWRPKPDTLRRIVAVADEHGWPLPPAADQDCAA